MLKAIFSVSLIAFASLCAPVTAASLGPTLP